MNSLARTASSTVVAAFLVAGSGATAHAAAPHGYTNCTALHADYPHGLGRPGAHDHVSGHSKPVTTFDVLARLYTANLRLDRDHDGIACEKR